MKGRSCFCKIKVKYYTEKKARKLIERYEKLIDKRDYFFSCDKKQTCGLIDVVKQGSKNRYQVLCVSVVLEHVSVKEFISWNRIRIV